MSTPSTEDSAADSTAGEAAARGGALPRRTVYLARPVLALLAAAVCACLEVLLVRTAVGTASGQRLDQLILSGAQDHSGRLAEYAELAVGTVSVPVMAALLALSVALALVRRRPGLLLPLAVLVAGANVTTQVMKHLLVTREALGPGIEVTPNSFPSGHTTLAATAMVALVLTSGRARWAVAPLGALWTTAAGIGTLVLGWHRPSDVAGAIIVAAFWTFVVLAADALRARRWATRVALHPTHGRRRRGAADPSAQGSAVTAPRPGIVDRVVALLLGLVGVVGLVCGALGLAGLGLPLDLQDAEQQTTSFLATSALIGGGITSWMALVLVLRTPTSRRSSPSNRVP